MSLFGALMGFGGDVDEDPFFGGPMYHINRMMNNQMNMMNSFFGQSPFGMLEGPLGGGSYMVPSGGRRVRDDFGMGLMPIGFPTMRPMFDDLGNSSNCHSYSQSTVMTMTSGPDGRPQVYQASSSTRQGPGGVKETRKAVADSRSGIKKMQIGHHIGERAHVVEHEKNYHSGEAEERQEFINLDEEEADDFNREFQTRIGPRLNAVGYSERRRSHHQPQQLALPSSSSSNSYSRRTPRAVTNSSRNKSSLSTVSRLRVPEMKKKRPHEYDSENSHSYKKKNFKKNGCRSSDPVPVIEEPDSDDDVQEIPDRSSKFQRTTIIEELE